MPARGERAFPAPVGPKSVRQRETAEADAALTAMRANPRGTRAVAIGEIRRDPPGIVVQRTAFGRTRIVDMLVEGPLPRIR